MFFETDYLGSYIFGVLKLPRDLRMNLLRVEVETSN